MKYRLVTQTRASRDVRKTLLWLTERSRAGAASWLAAFEAALRRLVDNPEGYSRIDEADAFPDRNLRQFTFKTRRGRRYRGVFEVDGRDIRVLRVIGPGQDSLTTADID